jgi:hypothetical protein
MEGPVIGEVNDQNPEDILEENWKKIARVAQLLIEKGKPSREDIEAEVFEPDEDEKWVELVRGLWVSLMLMWPKPDALWPVIKGEQFDVLSACQGYRWDGPEMSIVRRCEVCDI